MSVSANLRRVVTGLAPDGRSTVFLDAPMPPGEIAATAWHTPAVPADNGGSADAAPPFTFDLMHNGGTVFMLVRMAPGHRADMHATDTIDYITMISGRMVLELETGEVALEPGTLCIDRGILHGWRNDGPEEAVYTVVTIPSRPVGKGSTV
jgi:quercetin dioxygenase-like cupin family protein